MKRLLLIFFCLCVVSLKSQAQKLDYFIDNGLRNSPLLKDYHNQIVTSGVDSLLVKAGQKPQINSTSQLLYAPAYNSFGYDEALSNGGNYTTVIDFSQYIFNGKTVKNKFENIGLQVMSLKNTNSITTNDLIRAITGQYLAALTDYNEMNNCISYITLLNHQNAILKRLVAQAIYKQSDYLMLEIEIQTTEINLNQIKNQLSKDVNTLRQLCGISDTNLFIPEMPKIHICQPSDKYGSPLFLQFHIDSLKLANEQESINLKYLPKISWYADAGLMSSFPSKILNHFGYSVGLNMSIPIFDGNQRKLDNRKIILRENSRSNYENYFRNQYSKQVEQLNSDLQSNRKTQDLLISQESSVQALIRVLENQLNSGNTTITELISAMKSYIYVKKNISQAQLKETEIINELNFLMQR